MTDTPTPTPPLQPAPGVRPRRRRIGYELLECALHGHRLVGTDAARVRPEDALLVRETPDGHRWHRCLRCDAWLPLPPPDRPGRETPVHREAIELPLRGRPLRDRYVLRLIAVDRLVHFVVLAVMAVAVFVFAHERTRLRGPFYRVVDDLQNGVGGPSGVRGHGLIGDLDKAFAAHDRTLWVIGLVIAAYAVLEGVEAIGLWRAKRWAEYLTFIATSVLLVPEVYELHERVSPLKVCTLVINLAVVAYLLFAKRLFGLRGGGRAEEAVRERDSGWEALERVYPGRGPVD
ncbi:MULTISPECIES: DUF2127 domain-containing protein [Streptomyces]|uniref:DUF2127 domain-containing protein n=1 Tax=Streptomyces TaxID=1883 RepID=UPI00163CF730|nr:MULTISPECIES: DUF2127 domain-containing protein [Streptomyces]MBC2875542.1 DUF2127 domain-containing protein [Streptomyces sp. TYQ1024]UBI35780.1 DUF2127 domain-containing protein [Streptomyces mobaraensis]UKW28373.1 DUF2127 domain-containing protein [Streptomyces sp. TYQ1024]